MFRSLRWRLQAWHTLILLLVVAGFGGMLYAEARRARFDEIDGELLAAARVLEGVLRTIPRPRAFAIFAAPGAAWSGWPAREKGASAPMNSSRTSLMGRRRTGRGSSAVRPPDRRHAEGRGPGPPGQRLMPERPPRHRARCIQLASFARGSVRRGGRAALLRDPLRRR